MKRKHTAESRLKLSRETLRRLAGADLQRIVAGGGVGSAQITLGCTTQNTCRTEREPRP
jgi:hypothetical protein